MRVLFVCSDADIGGAERLLVSLARSWDSADELGLVVLMDRGTLSEELEDAFSHVVYLGFPPSSRNLPAMVRSLESAVEDFAPDVISSHLFHADFVTALARTRAPRVSTMHTHGFGPGDHWLTKVIARAVGALSSRFATIIPTSDSPAMARFLQRLRMRNVSAPILNGSALPADPAFDDSARTFVALSRNHPVKGHVVLLQAFATAGAALDGWRLRIVGADLTPDDPRVEEWIREFDLRAAIENGSIAFDGPTTRPESVLAEASVLVISSLYGETFPLVGLEAAGLGIPVITSDVGSCRQFADDPRFLTVPGDVEDLRRALTTYAGLTDAERAALSRTARERALRDYDSRAVADHYRAVFSDVIEKAWSRR